MHGEELSGNAGVMAKPGAKSARLMMILPMKPSTFVNPPFHKASERKESEEGVETVGGNACWRG